MKLKKLFSKKSKAQAMVEFAIALPVLLMLLYGILETGRFVFMYSTVVNASRQAVRYGSATGPGTDFTSTGGPNNTSVTRYQDCYGIRNTAQKAGFIGAFNTITIVHDDGVTTANPPTPINSLGYCSAQTDPYAPTGNNSRITVTVTKDYIPMLPKLLPFIRTTITATSSRTIITSISIAVTSAAQVLETTTTTITTPTLPDVATNIGQSVTVTVTVTGTSTTPTGTVSITGADTNCTITLSGGTGSCDVIFTSGGLKTITATYSGDATHATSTATFSPHKVLYGPVITITSQSPNPSTSGQTVGVAVSVTGTGGTPTGTVTISGANAPCTITLAGGIGSCNIVFTSATTKTVTITATYSGDTNYSTGSTTADQDVILNKDTIIRITSDAPDPSTIGQSVTVAVKVVGLSSTPTGTVTITGADAPCTITLSGGTGSCNVTFSSSGVKSISAAYNGDANHNTSSTSTGHTVNLPTTTTSITSETPDPSNPGQTVGVTVTVTGGTTTPTGTVTITGADTNCTITLASGTGSCNVVFNSTGTKTLSAVYSGDSLHAASNTTASHAVVVIPATPVPSCNSVTHGAITRSGNTMTMTITNPYSFPLTTDIGTVTWNDDKGHQTTGDKTLSLQSITIGGTTVWTGSTAVNVSTQQWTTSAVIPPNSTVSITFTFQQSYDNFDGTEAIYMNLTTPGCESNPIQAP